MFCTKSTIHNEHQPIGSYSFRSTLGQVYNPTHNPSSSNYTGINTAYYSPEGKDPVYYPNYSNSPSQNCYDPSQKSKVTHFDLSNMFYFTILLVILYLMITAWDSLIDAILSKWMRLDPNSIFALFIYALIFTIISIFFLYILDEDFGYLFGIDSGSAASFGGGIAVIGAK